MSHRLPIVNASPYAGEIDVDAELARFEADERERLGLKIDTEHWYDKMVDPQFTRKQRETTTILVSGLTAAHDLLVKAALTGLGYKVEVVDVPDNDALRYGKEFGNRGQCNPTYFTVGNLVKFLTERKERDAVDHKKIVNDYVFLTAGACGPCRFGMYATEYRKALRDAGFDGFRVVLFQQKGGLKQATGEEAGLELSPPFFIGILKALLAGDVINGMGYRLRPYEVVPGSVDETLAKAKQLAHDALVEKKSILLALMQARKLFSQVKVDFTRVAPRVSIIGEFWAMTTEGDGNYQLQRFLEGEGAECDVQFVTNWILYMLWEGRYDTKLRADLREQDHGRKSLKNPHVGRTLATLFVADMAIRAAFHVYGKAIGFNGYKLPDMDQIADLANKHYDNQLRGGEGHMEVGKFILNVTHKKSHMTLSVKPFGCMPSSGVSDGVQSLITGMYPQSIFCAIETSGDGKVNVQSRVQMYLFKAKQAALREMEETLAELGISLDQVKAFLGEHPSFGSPFHRAPHAGAGTAVDLVHEVAPYIGKSRTQVALLRARSAAEKAVAAAKETPSFVARTWKKLQEKTPVLMERAREEWEEARPVIVERMRASTKAKVDAALAKVPGVRTKKTAEPQQAAAI